MFNLKPELREAEAVLGEYGATVYMVRGNVSSKGSNIRLWLTNQRLILKAALGPQRTLPLHTIVDIREEKIMWYNMVRIEFAGGHLEWFTVQNQPQFLQALKAAQAQAPVIPESVPLATSGPVNTSSSKNGIVIIAVIGAAILGMCAILVGCGAFWLITSAP